MKIGKKGRGLLGILFFAGLAYYLSWFYMDTKTDLTQVGYANHGLRIYLDPDTGEYARPPESVVNAMQQALIMKGLAAGISRLPQEQRSSKLNGGYAIDLQERFRPSRKSL